MYNIINFGNSDEDFKMSAKGTIESGVCSHVDMDILSPLTEIHMNKIEQMHMSTTYIYSIFRIQRRLHILIYQVRNKDWNEAEVDLESTGSKKHNEHS